MKLNLGKFTVEGFSIETKGINKGWIAVAIGLTVSIIITVCIVVRINIDYSWTNRPQIEQPSNTHTSTDHR